MLSWFSSQQKHVILLSVNLEYLYKPGFSIAHCDIGTHYIIAPIKQKTYLCMIHYYFLNPFI
jgi:hypothetical protein